MGATGFGSARLQRPSIVLAGVVSLRINTSLARSSSSSASSASSSSEKEDEELERNGEEKCEDMVLSERLEEMLVGLRLILWAGLQRPVVDPLRAILEAAAAEADEGVHISPSTLARATVFVVSDFAGRAIKTPTGFETVTRLAVSGSHIFASFRREISARESALHASIGRCHITGEVDATGDHIFPLRAAGVVIDGFRALMVCLRRGAAVVRSGDVGSRVTVPTVHS